jgi:beta-galactosidase
MMIRLLKAIIAVFLLLSAGYLPAQGVKSMHLKYNFNPGWKMWVGDKPGVEAEGFDDKDWEPVTLPHAFNEDDAFRKPIQELRTGIVWYRKRWVVPVYKTNQKVFLEFEGIRQGGEFYLNGKWIGRHENGVMAFGFDITDEIRPGKENVLAVRVDNAWDYHEKATNSTFEWNDRNFYANYGGINKNVYLHVTAPLYQTLPLYSTLGTTGVYIYAKDFDIAGRSATITAETQVKNEYDKTKTFRYQVLLVDADGKTVKDIDGGQQSLAPGKTLQVSARARVDGLHWWSWGYGYLYRVYTILWVGKKAEDVVVTTTGFRKTQFDKGMLTLNDRAIQLKGYGQRTTNEWPAIGLSVPAWLSDLSNHLMVESNANLVRWMHVTPWKQDVQSCDRVGLMESMPAGDSEKDVEGRRWQQRVELMRDAIIYNRNNPSIVFYECGNKGISEAHMQEMKQVRDLFDPHGGRAIGAREMLNSKVAEYGGEMLYIDKSATRPFWEMEYSRDEGLRKYWDEYSPPFHKDGDGPKYKNEDASIYNRNQDSHAIEDVARWYDYWHERPGTGQRVSAGGVNIIFSESNTHYRGAENYRRSGEVDALRIPKDGFYAHQVMWDGWVDTEKPRIHIIGHWNYAPGVVKNIYVVSSAEKVQLFVNGKSMGWGERSDHFLFTFKKISWKPGVISATGYDASGHVLCEARHETAGPATAIRLTPHTGPGGLLANGADLALVDVEVTDAKGRRCPTDLSMIHFDLKGPASWRGGMAQGPDNYILSKDLPVECGVNRVLIRSAVTAGKIYLKATAAGLSSAEITISSQPFEEVKGLSKRMPDLGLVGSLDRGPTPKGPSYRMSRTAIKIVGATAGSNADNAALSYDDNETTDWVNDGQAATAWIQYELERPALVSQIELKLNNFRTRSYPLRITVDGQEVFRGATERNLGYYTVSFPARKGKTVRIELTGNGRVETRTGVEMNGKKGGETGTEVNGKKLDDGVARDDSGHGGRLSIIEAEVYEDNIPKN